MKAVLFDLDGTLLPMDQDKFTQCYFSNLAKYFAPKGYEPKGFTDAVIKGTYSMIKNDGSCTNEQAFWQTFAGILGQKVYNDIPDFEHFYRNEFENARVCCGFTPAAGPLIKALKSRGVKVILASNPVFPLIAHHKRMGWAGLDINDFCYITSYENSRYCKPNPDYYTEILKNNGLDAKDCVMVGNDVTEDMAALKAGLDTFLVTDCIINRNNEDISRYNRGNFADMAAFLLSY